MSTAIHNRQPHAGRPAGHSFSDGWTRGWVILGVAAVIMLVNTFTHPPDQSYDYVNHYRSVEANKSLRQWRLQPLPKEFEYNPPLYYYVLGKPHHVIELVAGRAIDPYYFFRLAHLAIILGLALLYERSLLPALGIAPRERLWFVLVLFAVPNLFLSQVMVRADHLLLLLVHILFYLWWRFDFPKHLATSAWRQVVWVGLLVAMANARHFALAAWALFFGWGSLLLIKSTGKKISWPRSLGVAGAIALIVVASSDFYFDRYRRGGTLATGGNDEFVGRQATFDRRVLFGNFEFNELLKSPNRRAEFRTGNSFWPRLYGDMWADHWLYFSGKFGDGVRPDDKVTWKRTVLLAAVPATLAYCFFPLWQSYGALRKLGQRTALSWAEMAALLSVGGFALLITFVYVDPRLPKNDTVKFGYILAYMWFPWFCVLDWLRHHPRYFNAAMVYTIMLFLLSLPLSLYPTIF